MDCNLVVMMFKDFKYQLAVLCNLIIILLILQYLESLVLDQCCNDVVEKHQCLPDEMW